METPRDYWGEIFSRAKRDTLTKYAWRFGSLFRRFLIAVSALAACSILAPDMFADRMSFLLLLLLATFAVFLGEFLWNLACAPHRLALEAELRIKAFGDKETLRDETIAKLEPLKKLHEQGGLFVLSQPHGGIDLAWSQKLDDWREEVMKILDESFKHASYGFQSIGSQTRLLSVQQGNAANAIRTETAVLMAELHKLRLIIMREDDKAHIPEITAK